MFQRLRSITKKLLIFFNLLACISFLAGSYAYLFDPKAFWFVGLFSLGSFYSLLVVFAFFIFWLFVKPVFSLMSTVAVLSAWGPVQNLVQLRMSPNFTVKKHPSHLRVMSWNVEHFEILSHKKNPENKQRMLQMINGYLPDVACFQEMVASDNDSNSINYIPDFITQLSFPYHHFSYNPKLDFDNNHHFGLVIFSRYPIINKRNISYPPHDYNSIFQYADIVKDGDTIRVFNFHLQSLKFNKDIRTYLDQPTLKDQTDLKNSMNIISKFKMGFIRRSEQSERIALAIQQSPYPVMVCGDFNDVPNSYAYHTIGNGLKNAFTEKGTGIGRTFYGISPTLRIDHIFVDPTMDVEQYIRVKKKLSDHFPIITDVFIRKP